MFKYFITSLAAVTCFVASAQAAPNAQENTLEDQGYLNLELPGTAEHSFTKSSEIISPVFLAAADDPSSSKMSAMVSESGEQAIEYEDRIFTANNVHKYLGIGSIGAALLTLLAPKEEDGAHEYLAKTSAVLGVGAVATGLVYHNEDISIDGGFKDPDNLHALWAGLGAVGIAMAASTGPDSPHATYGTLGAIGMIVGIRYTW